jgi:very-short-patch-repair endonuclease
MTTDKQTPDKPKKMAQKPRKQPKTDIFTSICKSDLKIEVVKEYKFHPTRKWRFDFAIPEHKIAIEIDGGVWNYGRHNRAQGYLADMKKFNAAASLGWIVLKFTPDEQYSRATFDIIRETIKNRENERDLERHPQPCGIVSSV